jgi:gliding motility-associated-like protein
MKKEFTNIEDLFRDTFDGYKVEPLGSVWKKINAKLNLKQFFSADFTTFNIFYTVAVVGLITVLSTMFIGNDQNESVNIEKIEKTELNVTIPELNNDTELLNSKNVSTQTKENLKRNIKKQRVIKTESSRVSEVIPFTKQQKLEAISHLPLDSVAELQKIKVLPPKPLFKIIDMEGCAPFEIKLQNNTKSAQKYEWTFGDGSKSKAVNPTHTYLYPGVYTVKLKATGFGGRAESIIDSVIVHEGVKNRISKSFKDKLFEGEPFAVSVKSNESATYEWDFGDGTYSYQVNPRHAYEKEGVYPIILRTWTENNCYDSVKVTDVVVIKSDEKIAFPNAFCPNMDGPTGGKYYKRELINDIFHPVVKGVIKEYNLKIYSRAGLLVFESNDVNIGWDGYYQNRLMPEGVYLYIATGEFEGGKPIREKHNVTVLYRK